MKTVNKTKAALLFSLPMIAVLLLSACGPAATPYNNFNVQRHRIRRSTLRIFRAEAHRTWAAATAAADG